MLRTPMLSTDPKLLAALNARLGEELQAAAQYRAHAQLARFWDYTEYAGRLDKLVADETEHANELIARILLLGGQPVMVIQPPVGLGVDLTDALGRDIALELGAVQAYRQTVRLAVDCGDEGTAEVLRHILGEEERHATSLHAQSVELDQMGEENWLANQA